jgi:hypothetical protein
MKKLDHSSYESLVCGAAPLARDPFGDKVFDLHDGRILKLFRRKRLLSSNTIFPYAARFAWAARKLTLRKIATVEVLEVFSIPSIQRQAALYRRVEGQPLRSALQRTDEPSALVRRLAEYFALLHTRGIYFRSLHFANLLVTPGQQFALIDVQETRFSVGSLRPRLRARNFRHLTPYEVDREAIAAFGLDRFLHGYLQASDLSPRQQVRLLSCLARANPFFAAAASHHLTAVSGPQPDGIRPGTSHSYRPRANAKTDAMTIPLGESHR